jgi:hypothetical protein
MLSAKELHVLCLPRGHTADVYDLCWSPDSKGAIKCSDLTESKHCAVFTVCMPSSWFAGACCRLD